MKLLGIILAGFLFQISNGKNIISIEQLVVDISKSGESRIVGGNPAQLGDYPYQGLFLHFNDDGTGSLCGCSILNEYWLVTAAHCTFPVTDLTQIQIHLGINAISDRSQANLYLASRIENHPDYNANLLQNDISLIQLTSPIVMTSSVQPIPLPQSGQNISAGINCTISGWGTTTEDGAISEVLQQATVPIVSNSQCKAWYSVLISGRDIPLATEVCAGYHQGGVDSCQGDSGGPLACLDSQQNYILQGVTSFGVGCAQAEAPGVYTRVSEYVEWIQNIIVTENATDSTQTTTTQTTTTTPATTTTTVTTTTKPTTTLTATTPKTTTPATTTRPKTTTTTTPVTTNLTATTPTTLLPTTTTIAPISTTSSSNNLVIQCLNFTLLIVVSLLYNIYF